MGVPVPYQVVVIGAGFGGIGMAIALKQAGIDDFVVLDRAGDLGGTWRDNSYPGLTCDIPSHLYWFSFRPWRWSRRFPPREEILAYLHALADERGPARTCVSPAATVAGSSEKHRQLASARSTKAW
jgi:cation diffusion facilitator CzcD-associated flavoprotein CzcO